MKEIIKILKNYKLLGNKFYFYVFFIFFTEAIFLIFPYIGKILMEILEKKGNFDYLLYWGMIGIIILIFSVFGWYISILLKGKFWGELYYKTYQNYRKKLFEKSYYQIIEEGTGQLISKYSRGAQAEAGIFLSVIHIFTNTIFKFIVIAIIFIIVFPLFIGLLAVFVLIIFIVNKFVKNNIKGYVEQLNKIYEKENRQMVKMIDNFVLIKIFNKVSDELEESKKLLSKHPKYAVLIKKYQGLFYPILFFFIQGLQYVFYIVIGYSILNGELSIAFLIMLVGYLWTMWSPVETAINELNYINEQIPVYKKLQEFIKRPNEIKNGEKNYIYKGGEIEFKNLYFSYKKGNYIFENFNLKILAGKKNALVGHSGGGKSTIIKILLRFYDYEKGEILVDNQELKSLKIESFYKEVGYLPQEPGIFDGTIRENMEYAFSENRKIENKEKQIWEALEKAQISDMIKKLGKGLDTEVGEKGVKLSGGEKQRLAIARIFLKNPEIIILDEPTSALDSISESKITKALDELTKNRTSIIIAHRLQTVMYSDQIIVLEKGKIESNGTHNELLQTSKIYKTLVDLQNGKILE